MTVCNAHADLAKVGVESSNLFARSNEIEPATCEGKGIRQTHALRRLA